MMVAAIALDALDVLDPPTVSEAPLLYNHAYADLIADPASLLTLAGCWVTPFPEDQDVYEEEFTINAWLYIKDMFPDIALGFSWSVWEGVPDRQIDLQIIRELELRVPGVFFEVESIPYGPMFNFQGIDWHEIRSYPSKPTPEASRMESYGKLLNQIGEERTPYHYETISHLTTSLWNDQPEISAFIQWLCHWSGNSLVDMTYDDYAENGYVDPFEWTREAIDSAWFMQDEADTFIMLAEEGQRKMKKKEMFIQFCEALLISNGLAITEVHHVLTDPE